MSKVAKNQNGLGPLTQRSIRASAARGASTIEPNTKKLAKLTPKKPAESDRSSSIVRAGTNLKNTSQSMYSTPGRGRGGRLPSIMSRNSGNQGVRDVYNTNFQLEIDSRFLSKRQHDAHISNFYTGVISDRIFGGIKSKLSPMLAKEKTVRDMMFTMRKGSMPLMNSSGPSRRNFMAGQTFQAKKKLKTDDSLFTQDQPNSPHEESTDKSSHHNQKPFLPHQSLNKYGDLETKGSMATVAQTSMFNALMTSGSHLIDESKLDPTAGNSIQTFLGRSLHASARNQLDNFVNITARKRSRQRRRRELAGPAELSSDLGFAAVGLFEADVKDDYVYEDDTATDKEKATETNTLANSSVYGLLHEPDDLESFQNFYQDARQESIASLDSKSSVIDKHQTRYLETKNKEALADPQMHFGRLKAKIKLKVRKDYQEDVERKISMLKKTTEPVIEVKDKWGRVTEKQRLFVSNKRRTPNFNRPPKKRPALKVSKSFVADQKRYDDADNMYDPMASMGLGPTLTDKITIQSMKLYQRWPIPECLMSRPRRGNFSLKVDSIMSEAYKEDSMKEWAKYRPQINAPYNSMEEADDLEIIESEDSEEVEEKKNSVVVDVKEDLDAMNPKLIEHSPFRMESMKYYPYKSREGEVPLKLLKVPKLDWLIDNSKLIAGQQKAERKWSMKRIQSVFDYYCTEHKAAKVALASFFDDNDPKNYKFSIKNFKLDEGTTKALACIIPFLVDVNEIELKNNQIIDAVAGSIILAIFGNPTVNRISICYNYMRTSFSTTLCNLIKVAPFKINYLNLMGSINFADHLKPIVTSLSRMRQLISLSIAGCGTNQHTCRDIASFIVSSFSIRELDVSHCKINFQGSRYIIDALNRNTTIRSFNFSHNDLQSQSYEFSIKVSSIITRHPSLMHLNIAETNLKREEVMFIGLSLSLSKVMVSLHLTAGMLPYYERIFLRSVISARVSYQFRNVKRQEVKSNKERNQLIQMAEGEVQSKAMQEYIDVFQDLDDKREGLDFEIQDLLEDLDTTATYQDISPETTTADFFPADSKVGMLISKMMERQMEIEDQKNKLVEILNDQKDSIKIQAQALSGVAQLAEMNALEFGKIVEQSPHSREEDEDIFQIQKQLLVERQRQRAETLIQKEHQGRSAGELALMFMGINQVSYDLLVENPMTGYMNEVIFSRVLGHDEVEQSQFWSDGTQCWVCQKWNFVQINYHPDNDKMFFNQKVFAIQNLHTVVNMAVAKQVEEEIKDRRGDRFSQIEIIRMEDSSDDASSCDVPATKLKNQFLNTLASKAPGADSTTRANTETQGFMNTLERFGFSTTNEIMERNSEHEDEDKDIIAESKNEVKSKAKADDTDVEEVGKPSDWQFDTTNTVSPVKKVSNILQRQIFPSNIDKINDFKALDLRDSYEDMTLNDCDSKNIQSAHGSRKHVNVRPLDKFGAPISSANPQQQSHARALQKQFLASGHSSSSDDGNYAHQTSVISTREHKRIRGQPVLVERIVFFDGMVYQIEEELYSDEDHSSVYTSEDSFEEDMSLMQTYGKDNPLLFNVDHQSGFDPNMNMTGSTLGHFTVHRNSMMPDGSVIDDKTEDGQKSKNKKGKKASKKKKKKVAVEDPNKKKRSMPQAGLNKQAFFSNSEGLTDQQKDYESKIWPKHYKENVMNTRMQKFDEIEGIMTESVAKHGDQDNKCKEFAQYVKGGSMIGKEGRTAEKNEVKPKELYVVCSFNDWMPMRMKTNRTLNLEKYPINKDEIPADVFQLDNTTSVYANMVPPGQHYFYLCEEKGSIFLSPKYEVVRFKNTNIYLNRIIVKNRLDDIETVHVAKDGNDEEAVFIKDKSIFRDYKDDTPAILKKAFDQDMEYAKINRLYKKDPKQYILVQKYLYANFVQLSNIFDYYSGASDYPRINMMDMTSFAHHTNLLDREYIGLAALDLLLVATNVSCHKYKLSAERDICRYEFLEFMVRTAEFRYVEKGQAQNTVEALKMLFAEYIYPASRNMNGEYFRKYFCYNVKTNEILSRNSSQIEKLYKSFTHSKKRYITLAECQSFVRKVDLKISEMMVGAMYAESMMTIIDNMSVDTRNNQMKYVEFIVFICRITHEHYESTDFKTELLYKKLDHMLPAFLAYGNYEIIFQFGEKFEAEARNEYILLRRKQKKLKKLQDAADAKGEKVDPRFDREVKEMEKQMRITGNSFLTGKSKLIKKKGKSESSDSSEEKAQSGKSSPRRSLIDQSESASILKANFGQGMSDHPSGSDEELHKPPERRKTPTLGETIGNSQDNISSNLFYQNKEEMNKTQPMLGASGAINVLETNVGSAGQRRDQKKRQNYDIESMSEMTVDKQ